MVLLEEPTAEQQIKSRAQALLSNRDECPHQHCKEQWYDRDLSDHSETEKLLLDIACLHNGDGTGNHTFCCLARPDVPAAYLVIGADSQGNVVGCNPDSMSDDAALSGFLQAHLFPSPETHVYHAVLQHNKHVFLVEIAVDNSRIGQPVRVRSKQHPSLLCRRPARSGSSNVKHPVPDRVWKPIVDFFKLPEHKLHKQLQADMHDSSLHKSSHCFEAVRRVLVVDELNEEQVAWLAALPWHLIVSFGPNNALKNAIPSMTGVCVQEFQLQDCAKARGGIPSRATVEAVSKGSARLFLTASAGTNDKRTTFKNLQGFNNVSE